MTQLRLSALILAAALATGAPALADDAQDEAVATAPPPGAAPTSAAPATARHPAAPPPATAPTAAGAAPSVAAQIDDYLRTSPALVLPKEGASGVTTASVDEPRKVHGVVDLSVGSGGYRSGYVRSDFPIGKTGTLSIAVEDTQYNGHYGGRFGGYGGYGGPYAGGPYGGFGGYGGGPYGGGPYNRQSVSLGLSLGGSSPSSSSRCRQGWDNYSRHHIDPVNGYDSSGCDAIEDDRAPLPDMPPQ